MQCVCVLLTYSVMHDWDGEGTTCVDDFVVTVVSVVASSVNRTN